MLYIKPSDVMDCYVGESEKLVKAIFSLARRLAPCLVFIDEVDVLFGKRKEDDKKWYRNILSEFLQSMDGLLSSTKDKEGGVAVIGATNRPQDIDDAVLRRLPSRMMVDLPGTKEREQILKVHLRGEKLDESLNLKAIASKTDKYSGSDLKNLCVSAAMQSLKQAIGDVNWNTLKKNRGSKTNGANDEESEKREAQEKINSRTLTMAHFAHAMEEISPSSSSDNHSELRRWHQQFNKRSGPRKEPQSYARGVSTYGSGSVIGSDYSNGTTNHIRSNYGGAGGFNGASYTPYTTAGGNFANTRRSDKVNATSGSGNYGTNLSASGGFGGMNQRYNGLGTQLGDGEGTRVTPHSSDKVQDTVQSVDGHQGVNTSGTDKS
ncbi:hypothetical protein M422DRAFT_194656 [Sphaerobolus stellatus SS14]|uniref:Vesicle-fusing ATPase n=1 Tax=Sphaerobolus stellatus (strain SS14) TaxID=990650 RepID=A0A0C9TRH0_SPHS4|nr:hypothetical protein M422DRAFT_194656 [Sphaerobolus stellatus SS14]